jgi:hypothetical protein
MGLDISLFSGVPSLLPERRFLRLLYQKYNRIVAMNAKMTETTIAMICSLLSVLVESDPDRAVLVLDAVVVAVPVDDCVLVVVVAFWGAETMFSVKAWDSTPRDDLEVAWIVTRIFDGRMSGGTSPLKLKACVSKESHDVGGDASTETMTSETFQKKGVNVRENDVPITAFTDAMTPVNIGDKIRTDTMAFAASP